MKLITAAPSPYGRKTQISLHEKQIKHEVIIDLPWSEDSLTAGKNPLGKVPILITQDNQYIFDSKVIIRHLDRVKPRPEIYPNDPRNHLSAITIEAVADGICDAVVLICLENARINNLISKQWVERQEKKVMCGLKYLSTELGSKTYFVDNYFNIADISAFTSLEYLDIRFKKFDWRKSFPNLNDYWSFHKLRESFVISKPKDQKINPITY